MLARPCPRTYPSRHDLVAEDPELAGPIGTHTSRLAFTTSSVPLVVFGYVNLGMPQPRQGRTGRDWRAKSDHSSISGAQTCSLAHIDTRPQCGGGGPMDTMPPGKSRRPRLWAQGHQHAAASDLQSRLPLILAGPGIVGTKIIKPLQKVLLASIPSAPSSRPSPTCPSLSPLWGLAPIAATNGWCLSLTGFSVFTVPNLLVFGAQPGSALSE